MDFLQYIKQYQNLDLFIVLMKELGYPDEEIISKLQTSKGSIYNARLRLKPLIDVLETMESTISYGDPVINSIIDSFKDNFGTTKVSQYDRYAARRLAAKYGADDIISVIEALSKSRGQKYCPSINSVLELERKLVTVIDFLKKQSDNNVMVIT